MSQLEITQEECRKRLPHDHPECGAAELPCLPFLAELPRRIQVGSVAQGEASYVQLRVVALYHSPCSAARRPALNHLSMHRPCSVARWSAVNPLCLYEANLP